MPAYARDRRVVVFFKNAQRFKEQHSTLGFDRKANLDDGTFWPTSFAVMELTNAVGATIRALVKKVAN